MSKIQSVKGMHDILPDQVETHQRVEQCAQMLFHAFGYHEIRLPLVENTALFKRSIGDVTDIVEKEMYTFADRDNTSLSLRPEGTASCVRASIQHGLIGKGQHLRLWYSGAFFRRERPQRARYRQFYQLGVEFFGCPEASADVEQLMMMDELLHRLGVAQAYTLQINTLGSVESRKRYRAVLSEYFTRFSADMNAEIRARIEKNPLRVLDSKEPALQDMILSAPTITESLDAVAQEHFTQLQEGLAASNIAYEHNPHLVRGLDYYSGTVFEFNSKPMNTRLEDATEVGSTITFCAGGRYDGLAEQLGGSATPAVGFAFGLDRFVSLYESCLQVETSSPDIYVVIVNATAQAAVPRLVKELQAAVYALCSQQQPPVPLPQLVCHHGDDKMKTQLKKANKLNAKIVLIFADKEIETQQATVKFMQGDDEQKSLSTCDMSAFAQKILSYL